MNREVKLYNEVSNYCSELITKKYSTSFSKPKETSFPVKLHMIQNTNPNNNRERMTLSYILPISDFI